LKCNDIILLIIGTLSRHLFYGLHRNCFACCRILQYNGIAFWDDLYLYQNTSQGLYYASQGNAPNRTLVFEFYTSHYSQPAEYYHFQVIFFESLPNVVQNKYFDASDGGVSCTVGVQGKKNVSAHA
jgi:hypothetical protein